MPDKPLASNAENVVSAIRRLFARSAELRESARRNGKEADQLTERIALLKGKAGQIAKP